MRAIVFAFFWWVIGILFATGVFPIDTETAPKMLAMLVCFAASVIISSLVGEK